MISFQVADLQNGQNFNSRVILDKHFVVLDNNLTFSSALQKRLVEWGFKTLYSENEAAPAPVVEKLVASKPAAYAPKAPVSHSSGETVDIDLDTLNEEYKDDSNALNTNLKAVISKINLAIKNFPNKDRMENVMTVYNEFLDYTQKVFTRYVTHKEMKSSELSESISLLIEFIKNNKKYILRIQPTEEHKLDKNFLTSHCLRSTIISIVIALQINMPSQKIIELGIAALIHEIGQIKLPPQLYLTDKPLSPQARNLLATHTVLGFNIVNELGFSLPIKVGILEHHERENGQGYPRHLTSEKISAFGKILSVACSYEAITSPRHYKEARTLYEATIELLLNKDKQYDDIVIKALVSAVSLFPIGTYVYLSNGKIGQVTESNPNDPRLPIVEIVGEKNELGNPKSIITDNDKNKIVRVLNKEELKGVQAYIK
ncbi:HD domain-containing phosphohydrolase [uncultured Treponema sp.]|uniref:HD-GYP domain-containing protein n=1 Tax=uncultured Treponema sp. TaxID=162155 RepID=UPI0025DE177D|nr:HD domain-containing phosphohydrolase [uncultured Treponema sp.]